MLLLQINQNIRNMMLRMFIVGSIIEHLCVFVRIDPFFAFATPRNYLIKFEIIYV